MYHWFVIDEAFSAFGGGGLGLLLWVEAVLDLWGFVEGVACGVHSNYYINGSYSSGSADEYVQRRIKITDSFE